MNKYITDRRSSLNSLNGLQIQPVAESTSLNLNNSNSRNFTWGFTSISPKQRSNSAYCLSNDDEVTNRRHNFINASLYATQRRKCAKIDPKVYADVKSRGLASRIVKYHEGGSLSLNRSSSLRSLYTKPGQFPVVNLKKSELPLRATKQSLSMTRIAPPRNKVFQGTTLSSLLRSNSVINIHKSEEHGEQGEHVSCENRPIMHPPPTESESAPTRSVLEKLKEISRKRINNEDLNSNETNKKYCNRNGDEAVDGSLRQPLTETLSTSKSTIKNHKRQRDTSSVQCELVNTPSEHSPPDQAKKRQCNYNNDISSSLSSSMSYRIKMAKLTEPSRNQTTLPQVDAPAQEIQQNCNLDVNVETISRDFSEAINTLAPITPLPNTPLIQEQQQMGAIPPTRTVSAPALVQFHKTIATNECRTEVKIKPRLTLFNKNYVEVAQGNLTAVGDDDSITPDIKCIQFIKPKKLSAISSIKNPIIEKTQKSKLALMLSGLRGELYLENDYDQVDSQHAKKNSELETPPGSADTSNMGNTTLVNSTKSAPIPETISSNVTTSVTPQDNTNKVHEATVKSTNALTNSTTTVTTTANAAPVTGFVNNTNINTSSAPVPNTAFTFCASKTITTSTTTINNNTQLKQTESNAVATAVTSVAITSTDTVTLANSVITNTISNSPTTTTTTTTRTLFVTSSDKTVPQSTSAPFNAFNIFSNQTAISNPEQQSKSFSFATNAANKLTGKNTGTAATTSSTMTTFNFSAAVTTSSESTKPILSVFGTPTTSISTSTSSIPSSIQKPSFAFGNATTSLTNTTNTSNASKSLGFTFNTTNATITQKPQAITAPITLSNSIKPEGFSSNLPSTFKFDTATTTNASNACTFGKTQPTATVTKSTTSANAVTGATIFTAAAPTTTTTTTKSIFGTITTNSPVSCFNTKPIAVNKEQPVFGVSGGIFSTSTAQETTKSSTASLFTFGMKSNQSSTTGGFSFATTTAASNNSGFSFGTNTITNNASASNIAGNTTFSSLANADQKKTFSFGNNVSNASLNLFRSDNSETATANKPGGFSFANASNTIPATSAATPVFTFGSGINTVQPSNDNSSTTSNPVKAFTFSSGGNQSNLTFGTSNALNTSGVSIFAVDKTSGKATTQPVFNFGNVTSSTTTTTPNLRQSNSNQNNIFAATNQNSINERPMRRATRRLQKS